MPLAPREVHLIGIPTFDPKPCKGTLKQTRTKSFETFAQSYQALAAEGYTFFSLDTNGTTHLGTKTFPKKSAFVIGHEEFGLSFQATEFPLLTGIKIPQFGIVQSLNASIAAGIVCFEYLRQHELGISNVVRTEISKLIPGAASAETGPLPLR